MADADILADAAISPDASVRPTDAAPPEVDAGEGPVTNHPGANIIDVSNAPFRLLSSAMVADTFPGETFVLWNARLVNTSGLTQCFSSLDAKFLDASGSELFRLSTFLEGYPYQGASPGFSIPCLADGDTTFATTIESFDQDIDLGLVRTIEYSIDTPNITGIPHPLAPTIVSSELREMSTLVGGVLRNDASSPIHAIFITVCPIQADGLTLDSLFDSLFDTLFPGESRAFETILSYRGVIAEYLIYLDFATGPAPPASAAGQPPAALLASRARERLLREQLSRARASRRAAER